jgi:drug/metabolite transporter (DMT)-like permease
MSVVNIVLPFFLITWAEQSVDSALAAILTGTVPLFVLVLAPLFLPDEPVTPARVLGLAVGFIGVVVLFAPSLVNLGDSDLTPELALLGSSVSYGIGAVYTRRNVRGLRPMIPALFQVGFALAISGVLALLVEQPIGRVVPAPEALIAVVWLGILGSGFAYLAFFRILRDWGATRTSAVAYLLPVVGLALGTFRGEAITLERLAGTALIIGGIALVNSTAGLARRVPAPREREAGSEA